MSSNLTLIHSPYEESLSLPDRHMAALFVMLKQGHAVTLYQSYTTNLSRYPWNQERPIDNA